MSDNDAIAFLINELVEERAQKRAYAEVLDRIAVLADHGQWTTLETDKAFHLERLVDYVVGAMSQTNREIESLRLQLSYAEAMCKGAEDELAKAVEEQAPDEAVPHPSPFGTVIGNAKDKEPAPPASDSDE